MKLTLAVLILGVMGVFVTNQPTFIPADVSQTAYYNLTGTDESGTIVIQTGKTWEPVTHLGDVVFNQELSDTNYIVILDPQNQTTLAALIKAQSLTTTGFTVNAQNENLQPGVTYEVNYVVVKR